MNLNITIYKINVLISCVIAESSTPVIANVMSLASINNQQQQQQQQTPRKCLVNLLTQTSI